MPLVIGTLVASAAAAVTYYALWPAMWTQPIDTVVRTIQFSARLGGTPHAPGNFLLGNTAEDPGPLFYPVALAFRLGPATSIGLLALIAFGIPPRARRAAWLLLMTAALFFVLIEISPKKVDRYLMPVTPLLSIVAAFGWWSALHRIGYAVPSRAFHASQPAVALLGIVTVVGLAQAWPLIATGRYSLAAYNPLFGGARTAEHAIPVGWGEGLNDAAEMITRLSGGAPVTTSIWFPLRVNFQAHMPGRVVTERQISEADYFVDYIHARQRKHTPPQLQRRAPDAVVTIAGVEYARIYRLR